MNFITVSNPTNEHDKISEGEENNENWGYRRQGNYTSDYTKITRDQYRRSIKTINDETGCFSSLSKSHELETTL